MSGFVTIDYLLERFHALKNIISSSRGTDIQLVITAALKKEIPKDWFESRGVAVHTLAALKSGASKQNTGTGMLMIITGAGLRASEEAACWIRDNLNPLFVLNIGTCGINDKQYAAGRWLVPRFIEDEAGDVLDLDTRLPVPCPEAVINVNSLLSVNKAVTGDAPSLWRKHSLLDMECYSQAKVFHKTGITFHCLKFGADYADANTCSDFNRNLDLFREEIKKLFCFLNTNPKGIQITIVIPVFNREHMIRRSIDSVLSQSYPSEEIIVVDDCSTDGTPGILESYGDKIKIIRLPDNSGPSRARNEGIKHAGTEWIAFLDSDDSWEKDKLKSQVEYLMRYPFYQIIQSEEKWIRNGKRVNPCTHHKKPFGWIWEQSLERCLVSPSGVMLTKSLLERHGGFDPGLPVCEDYDLWLKISRHHPVGLGPDLSVIKYGGHKDQLSHKYPAMDRFRVKSLVNLLKEEPCPEFREKIIHVLKKKLEILIKGYEKRQKSGDALDCRKILDSINEFQ
jgi:GT2 family glycosyltransferase